MVSILAALLLQVTAATPVPALQPGETLLEVSTTGEASFVPDLATFSTGVTSDGSSGKAALAANAAITQRLVSAALSAGVADADVRTSQLSVRPRYKPDKDGDDSDVIIGYRAVSRLSVKVRSINQAPSVVDALVNAGATNLEGPDFSFADDTPLTARARAKAIANAALEANDYASALGLRVSRVLRVSERSRRDDGGSDIVVTAERKGAPIRPGEQSISVTVWIDYALAK